MNTSNYDSIMNNFLTQVSDGNPVFRGITYTAGGGEETRNSIIDILTGVRQTTGIRWLISVISAASAM